MNGIAIIGAGAMGTAFAKGMVSAGLFDPAQIVMADADASKLSEVAEAQGVKTSADNAAAVENADVILLAVKPQIIKDVLTDIGGGVQSGQLVISIAAGVKLRSIESCLPEKTAVIRAMPNTPCQIGRGAVGFCRGSAAADDDCAKAKAIFDAVGVSFEVPEKLMDAVTGLSGSGPAYVYVMIEAMADAGVRVGLPRDAALSLASQTVAGAAEMVLESGQHPAALKDQVTSPGGTTIAGLDALERAGFRSALIDAVKAAAKRSEELG